MLFTFWSCLPNKLDLCCLNLLYIPTSEDVTINNHSSWWSLGLDVGEQTCHQLQNGVNLSISSECHMSKWHTGCRRGPVFPLSFHCCALTILCITIGRSYCIWCCCCCCCWTLCSPLQGISVPPLSHLEEGLIYLLTTEFLFYVLWWSGQWKNTQRRLITMLGVICHHATHYPLIPFQILIF